MKSKDLKEIKENLKIKNGFLSSKHGLKVGIKISYILVSKREKNGREEQKEKEEEEKKKKKEEEEKSSKKVWHYMVLYGITWAFKALNGFPCNCMVISCLQT